MTTKRTGTVLALALAVAAVAVVGSVPLGAASHGAGTNFTVEPVDAPADRRPDITDASMKQFAHPDRSIQRIDYFVVEWQAGVVGSCGQGNLEALGIDRGDDDPGTATDEGLLAHVESTQRSDHRVVAEFYDEEDFQGQSTHINATDELVSHQSDCYGTPEEPGWYQLTVTVNGTDWSGEYVEMTVASHYFWICDCASEREARNRLGPPPSERSGRATPTATATATAAPETSTPARSTDRTTDAPSEPTTPTASPTATAATAPPRTATATSARTGTVASSTGTPAGPATTQPGTTQGSGPGFGVVAAVLALVAALLARGMR